MNVFTEYDLANIQAYIDQQLGKLASIGLELVPAVNMAEFACFLDAAPDALPVPSTHDPERSYLHPGNAYWTMLRDGEGRIAACNGQRLIETGDLFEDIRTHRFFKDRMPLIRHYPLELYPDLHFPHLDGRISVGGGMWVHPDWRGHHPEFNGKIYGVYSPLVRAIALRHFKLDWYCALYRANSSRTALGRGGSGFTNAVNLLNGMFPLQDRIADMQFMWMSREEMIQYIRDQVFGEERRRQA